MITTLSISNFRGIESVEMTLERLTVLVGPNASGKTSVLRALAAGGFDDSQLRRGERSGEIIRELETGYRQTLGSVPQHFDANHRAYPIHQFQLNAMRQPNQVEQADALAEDGGNLANALASLPRREQDAVARELRQLVDAFRDVDVRPGTPGHHRIVFQDRWNEDVWLETEQVSDGTMMVLAFLVLQHQRKRPETVCIEEPERGLHPYLLARIIGLLRDISQGKHGPPTQFVLATQSAELLDHVQPHEVRFLERDADGRVQVRTAPTEDEAWANAIDTYENSIGQMWLSGSLGGVPGQ